MLHLCSNYISNVVGANHKMQLLVNGLKIADIKLRLNI